MTKLLVASFSDGETDVKCKCKMDDLAALSPSKKIITKVRIKLSFPTQDTLSLMKAIDISVWREGGSFVLPVQRLFRLMTKPPLR